MIARFGALSAKPQNGFGVVEWREKPQFDRSALARFVGAFPEDVTHTSGMFNVRETAFLEFEIRNADMYSRQRAARIPSSANPDYLDRVLPVAYDIRYKSSTRHFRTGAGRDRGIRPALKNLLGRRAEEIVGTSARSSHRSASRVFVSHLYRRTPSEPYRLRCWVHVPPDLERQRQGITDAIRNVVTEMFPGSSCKPYAWSDFQKEVL